MFNLKSATSIRVSRWMSVLLFASLFLSLPIVAPQLALRANAATAINAITSATWNSLSAAGSFSSTAQSANYTAANGWNVLQNGNVDDGFVTVPFPAGFTTTFNSTQYSTAYISSNTYITFTGGSGQYSGLTASSPALPGVHFCSGDDSFNYVA